MAAQGDRDPALEAVPAALSAHRGGDHEGRMHELLQVGTIHAWHRTTLYGRTADQLKTETSGVVTSGKDGYAAMQSNVPVPSGCVWLSSGHVREL